MDSEVVSFCVAQAAALQLHQQAHLLPLATCIALQPAVKATAANCLEGTSGVCTAAVATNVTATTKDSMVAAAAAAAK